MREVFASAMGQYDNLGDTVLRRPYLRTLRELGPLNVFVGNRPDDYLSALGIESTDVLFRDSAQWRRAISRSITRQGAVYAFNAGEIETTRPYAMHYLRVAPLLAANRLRGGRALHVGLGVRRPTRWVPAIRGTLRLCDVVSWRDHDSQMTMKTGGVAPDWGFAEGADDATLLERAAVGGQRSVVVAPRHNGARFADDWCERFAAVAEELDLEIVVAAQTVRDNAAAEVLARKWSAETVLWDSPHHAAHEIRLREAYSQAAVVVSERLHALVLGATEGATPVAVADAPRAKAVRTIRSAGLAEFAVSSTVTASIDPAVLGRASSSSHETATQVISARRGIETLKERVRRAVAH